VNELEVDERRSKQNARASDELCPEFVFQEVGYNLERLEGFDHQNDWRFSQPEMPRRYPALGIAGCSGVSRIEGGSEAVVVWHFQFGVMNTAIKHGQHNLGRRRQ